MGTPFLGVGCDDGCAEIVGDRDGFELGLVVGRDVVGRGVGRFVCLKVGFIVGELVGLYVG